VTSFVMNGFNVVLNWVLIYGRLGAPALGVGGAALASSLAGLITALVIVVVALRPSLRRRHGLFGRGCVRRDLLRPLLRVGLPQAAQGLGLVSGLVVFYGILGLVSTVAVAAGNIVMRLAAMCLMAAIGVGVAVQTLVSRCLGARDARGAWRTGQAGFCLAAALMAVLGLPFLLWPDLVLGAFGVDEAVLVAGRGILRITALVQLLAAAGLVFAGVLRGAGATDRVLAVDVGTGAGFMLPVAWLFAVVLDGGLRGAWWALTLWFALHAVLMSRLFLRRRWLRIRL
jgi:putative MATE family efflux protein